MTIGGETYPLPRPFLVLATQNPIESEGTYPLPEAQVDRFLFKLLVDYPTVGEEAAVVGRAIGTPPEVRERVPVDALERYREIAPRRVRRPRRDRLRGRAGRRHAPSRAPRAARARAADRVRRQPARADRHDPGRPGAGAAARPRTTWSPRTSPTSQPTCCATGSCSPTTRSATASRPTTCSTASSPPSAAGSCVRPARRWRHERRGGGMAPVGLQCGCGAAPAGLAAPARQRRCRWTRRAARAAGPGPDAGRARRGARPRARPPRGGRAAGRAARGGPRHGHRARADPARTRSATTCAGSTPPPAPAPGSPHVRDHVPERTLTTWVLLDVSASMAFGTATRLKSDVAEGVALGDRPARRPPRRPRRPAHLRRRRRRGSSRRAAAVQPLVALRRALGAGRRPRRPAAPEDALAVGLRRIARLARGPGLVVVVSDFREGDPAADRPLWARAIGALAAPPRRARGRGRRPARGRAARRRATSCSSTPRRARGWRPTPPAPSCGAASRRPSWRGATPWRRPCAAPARGTRSVHGRRLAARARQGAAMTGHDATRARPGDRVGRRRPAPELRGRPAMSFQAPLFLLGLAIVPLALAALAFARRRPARYVVRFPALPTLAAVVAAHAALAPGRPAGAALPRARRAGARAGAAGGDDRRAGRARVGDARHRHVGLDERDRCRAARAWPRPSAAAERFLDRVPDELQVGLVAYADGPHTVLRPTQDREQVQAALDALARRRRHGDGRCARARAGDAGRPRQRQAAGRRSCCSPTARTRPAASPPTWRATPARPASPSTPSRSAPPTAR